MLLFSVDYYLVAKLQKIYEMTKYNLKNNTRITLKKTRSQLQITDYSFILACIDCLIGLTWANRRISYYVCSR